MTDRLVQGGLCQPHVQVALRMKEQKQSVQTHDLIPYIICDSESINPEVMPFAPQCRGVSPQTPVVCTLATSPPPQAAYGLFFWF